MSKPKATVNDKLLESMFQGVTMNDAPNKWAEIAVNVSETVAEKNRAYGASYDDAPRFIELLYPNGVAPSQYPEMLTLVRCFDKMKRVATDADAFGEDPWKDLCGYTLLAIERRGRSK